MGENTEEKWNASQIIFHQQIRRTFQRKGAGDWLGSTYGAIQGAVTRLCERWSCRGPCPPSLASNPSRRTWKNDAQLDHVLVPEINNGQLVKVIRDRFLIPAIPFNKIKGVYYQCRTAAIMDIINGNLIYYESGYYE